MSVNEKLLAIQSELKAPKDQFNKFGKYPYRSNEGILESLKPLLVKHKCVLIQIDRMVSVGDRNYVEAMSKLIDLDTGEECCSIGLSREDESIKGMHQSQITGSTSSYARKYSLNGLFLIDDSKDSDVTNNHSGDNNKLTSQSSRGYNNNSGEDKTKNPSYRMILHLGKVYDKRLNKNSPEWIEFKNVTAQKYGVSFKEAMEANVDQIIESINSVDELGKYLEDMPF